MIAERTSVFLMRGQAVSWILLRECNDPVSVSGFVPGFMDGLFMNDCGPGLMDMLFD